MANIKIEIHRRNLETRKNAIDSWKISDEDKKSLFRFLDELSLGKVNKGTKVSETRQLKYLDILKVPLEFFNKPTSKLTLKDVEAFERALTSDKIKSSKKNTPFAISTKADIRMGLRAYLKWRLKEKAIPLTDWFDTKIPKKTPDFLSEQEIDKLYKNCKSVEERFLIAVLFDSGARAEEFHNIRFEDIQLPKDKDSFVKITLKEEYSKTKGRVISLYWKYSLEAVNDYLDERKKEGIKMDDPIFRNKYDNARQILVRLGKKVLNKSIHYHLFRHSSATYYAPKMNRQELCYRYGWAFSSDMPDVYISRAGMENKQLDEKFTQTELSELQRKLEKERLDKELKIEEIRKQLEAEIDARKKESDARLELNKEVDWDNMIMHRMVANPKLAPKMLKAMANFWKKMEQEDKLKAKSK